jgi:glycosyltransferase involved in cell wall biosynthesis
LKRPRVSVVIDNYNYGRFLRATLDSVVRQDFPKDDFEIIVSDDGSTDDSRAVIAFYGERVIGVLNENRGQATAFNKGIAAARGELVFLLDSDDVWSPDKLKKMVPLFDDPKVGVAAHFLQDVDAGLKPLKDAYPAWPSRYTLDDFLDGRCEFTATSGLAFRKSVLEKALPIPKDLFYYLDDFLGARCLFYSEMANLPEVLGLHRVHGGNWCAGGYEDPRKIEVDFKNRELFARHLSEWLAEAGRALTPRFIELERLEVFRRRVLFRALRAEPALAWQEWIGGVGALGTSRLARFRAASVLLAVVSPTLYLGLYSAYANAGDLKSLRLRLFPHE